MKPKNYGQKRTSNRQLTYSLVKAFLQRPEWEPQKCKQRRRGRNEYPLQ